MGTGAWIVVAEGYSVWEIFNFVSPESRSGYGKECNHQRRPVVPTGYLFLLLKKVEFFNKHKARSQGG